MRLAYRFLEWLRELVSLPAGPELRWAHVAVHAASRKSAVERPSLWR